MNHMMFESGGSSRRRAKERRRKIMFRFVLFALVCGFFFWFGGETVRSSEVAFKTKAEKLQQERAALDQKIIGLESEVQSTTIRYQQLEEKYKTEVPQGAFKDLTDMVKKRLDAGIRPDRLAFIINQASPPKNCSPAVAKRFVVKTPVYSGPHGTVAFGNGVITVTGEGKSAIGSSGSPEAWYDPGKPVKLKFIELGGKETVKESLLPIQHSMVVGNKEYRFTVAAGERSFIAVTSDSCDYP